MTMAAFSVYLMMVAQMPLTAQQSSLLAEGRRLELPFQCKDSLWEYKDYSEIPSPERIVLREGSKLTVISKISELRRKVVIRSSQQALEFARLTTSPLIQLHGEGGCIFEILDRRTIDEGWVGCDRRVIKWALGKPDGIVGLVSREWLHLRKIAGARVSCSDGVWHITRYVIVSDSDLNYTGHLRRETVGRQGEYQAITGPVVPISPPHGGWTDFPTAK